MFAVIETGGKQYKVTKGSVIKVEKLEGSIGDHFQLNNVLLIADEGKIVTGNPFIEGSNVQVTILDQDRDHKVRIFKFKQRKRYRRTQGHRQYFTKLIVNEIQTPAAN